jgi:hypothetical protein
MPSGLINTVRGRVNVNLLSSVSKSLFGKFKSKPEKPPEESVFINAPHLRPNTKVSKQYVVYCFHYAGLGDYIQWTTAVQWNIETHQHLHGYVYAQGFFYGLAKEWFKKYAPRFEVRSFTHLKDIADLHPYHGYIAPDNFQMINSCGFHLLDLGFHYFSNIDYIPDGWRKIPEINGDECSVDHLNLPEKFCVITTEATAPVRTLKPEAVNGMVKWAISKGITPVFLGKKEILAEYQSKSIEGISTVGVLDLREKTSILECAVILSKAQFVAGLDNGLLHLAACSMVPVVWGFTTVDHGHRVPPRRQGAKQAVVLPYRDLPCRFCQSHVRAFPGWDYRKCLYDDYVCLDMMTAERFIRTIEQLLA